MGSTGTSAEATRSADRVELFATSAPLAYRATKPSGARCPYARLGIAFYRARYLRHQLARGVKHDRDGRKPRNCSDARWLSVVWAKRAKLARVKLEKWRAEQRRRLRWDPSLAINVVFGEYAGQAHRVVSCESGHDPNATNGQYLGMFQMGHFARSTYGHGPDPLTQARAAYRYFVASGKDWSPWSCKPW